MTHAAIFKIKVKRRQIVGLVLVVAFLSLNGVMRYGIWRRMQYYNLEKTRYEKLDLAYQLKGLQGIDYELKNMVRHNPLAQSFVARAGKQLKEAKDAGICLKAAHARDRHKIDRLRSSRFILSCIIYVLVAFQVLLNLLCWIKDHRHTAQPSVK